MDVQQRLHASRTEVLARGHAWDVADVMAVLGDPDDVPQAVLVTACNLRRRVAGARHTLGDLLADPPRTRRALRAALRDLYAQLEEPPAGQRLARQPGPRSH